MSERNEDIENKNIENEKIENKETKNKKINTVANDNNDNEYNIKQISKSKKNKKDYQKKEKKLTINGISIWRILAYFIIYLGYLNIYNNNKEPITIRKALSFVTPYFGLMVLAWIAIVIGWYLIGLPLGPQSMPNL